MVLGWGKKKLVLGGRLRRGLGVWVRFGVGLGVWVRFEFAPGVVEYLEGSGLGLGSLIVVAIDVDLLGLGPGLVSGSI